MVKPIVAAVLYAIAAQQGRPWRDLRLDHHIRFGLRLVDVRQTVSDGKRP